MMTLRLPTHSMFPRAPQFGGHFARPLKGVYFQPYRDTHTLTIARQVQRIGEEEGFAVAAQVRAQVFEKLYDVPVIRHWCFPKPVLETSNRNKWGQDCKILTLGKVLGVPTLDLPEIKTPYIESGTVSAHRATIHAKELAQALGRPYQLMKSYLEGGNLFLGEDESGNRLVLLGEQALTINMLRLYSESLWRPKQFFRHCGRKLRELLPVWGRPIDWPTLIEPFRKQAMAEIAADLDLPPQRVHLIPQQYFHLDMSVRPLQFPYVLVHDPALSRNMAESYRAEVENKPWIQTWGEREDMDGYSGKGSPRDRLPQAQKHPVTELVDALASDESYRKTCGYADTETVCEAIQQAGLIPIRIGGVFGFQDEGMQHVPANFLNAVVHQRPNGELVYLTNDSSLPELNGIFEAALKKAAPWVQRVEFVGKSEGLGQPVLMPAVLKQNGGLHCLSVEDPDETLAPVYLPPKISQPLLA